MPKESSERTITCLRGPEYSGFLIFASKCALICCVRVDFPEEGNPDMVMKAIKAYELDEGHYSTAVIKVSDSFQVVSGAT